MWQGHQSLPDGGKRRQNYSGIGSINESSHENQSENRRMNYPLNKTKTLLKHFSCM